jgi:hypothetical protein
MEAVILKELIPGWKVVKGFALTIQTDEDGTIIVSDDLFHRYGDGATRTEAMDIYIESLTTYYELLAKSISDEYPHNEKYLEFMKEYILRIDEEPS